MMMTLADPAGFTLFVLASILVSLAAIPVGLTTSTAPSPIDTVRVRIFRLYRLSPVGFVGCLAVGLANGSFWALGPLFAQSAGLDVTGIAVFMSVTVIGGAIGQWPFGLWSDRTDRRKVIIVVCMLAAGVGLCMSLFAAHSRYATFALAGLFGACAFPLYAVSVAHMNDFVAKDEFVEASSGLLLVFAAGAVAGPALSAVVVGAAGPYALFAGTAVVHMSMAVFALWRMHRRQAPPEAERTHFTEALHSTQTASSTFDIATHEPEADAATRGAEPKTPTSL